MWILVDTNVFLDLLLKREGCWETAREFFYNCIKTKSKIFVTAMSLRDIEYAVHRETHDAFLARKAVVDVYSLCTKVIDISASDAIESIYSDIKDFEDSLIIESAKSQMMNLIVTRNIKDYRNCSFPVMTPKEYNDIIRNLPN